MNEALLTIIYLLGLFYLMGLIGVLQCAVEMRKRMIRPLWKDFMVVVFYPLLFLLTSSIVNTSIRDKSSDFMFKGKLK